MLVTMVMTMVIMVGGRDGRKKNHDLIRLLTVVLFLGLGIPHSNVLILYFQRSSILTAMATQASAT
jgi:hypothetical protein